MSSPKVSDPLLFNRPYPSRRQRQTARRRAVAPVSKLLLRVLALLIILFVATLVVVFKDGTSGQTATGAPTAELAPARLPGPTGQ